MAGCRSTLSMSNIKVRISETKYRSFYKTLDTNLNILADKRGLNRRATRRINVEDDCLEIVEFKGKVNLLLKAFQVDAVASSKTPT